MNAGARDLPESTGSFKWFPFISAMFVTTLIVSNIIAVKLVTLGGLFLPAAVILFPIAYIFGDILTEVYGYRRARQVIWTGFLGNLIAVIAIWIAGLLPAAPFWSAGIFSTPEGAQAAYDAILGFAPRLLLASFSAYLISSTLIGEGADSLVFITVAFYGIFPPAALGQAMVSQWAFKVAFEVLATPLTYWAVNSLKRAEGVDFYDRETNFNPFSA
jgi:uncharacterized PurR-regulated membrane protein YhhQ (DUF165 family)